MTSSYAAGLCDTRSFREMIKKNRSHRVTDCNIPGQQGLSSGLTGAWRRYPTGRWHN